MHPNMCSFTKAVLEDPAVKEMDGIILTSCCDSVRRLYDVLVRMYPDKFIYMLDVPRKVNGFLCKLLPGEDPGDDPGLWGILRHGV